MLLLRHAIHVFYGECSLNPLSTDELQLAKDEMKGFKIPSDKEITEMRKSGSKRKVGDTSAVDRSTRGVVAAGSSSAKSSSKMTPG